jgi:probable rRNA maturation factor
VTAPARSTEALPAFDGLTAIVSVEDEAWHGAGLGDLDALVLRCIRAAARVVEIPVDSVSELSATFADNAAVQALNGEWRGKDKPTNVLSFPMLDLVPGDRPGPMLGDVILARETVAAEAVAEGKSLHDHLCHLIVHGFMHCLGFDHVDPEDADEMEGLEIDILSDLGIADPYAAAGTPMDDTERTADRQ